MSTYIYISIYQSKDRSERTYLTRLDMPLGWMSGLEEYVLGLPGPRRLSMLVTLATLSLGVGVPDRLS